MYGLTDMSACINTRIRILYWLTGRCPPVLGLGYGFCTVGRTDVNYYSVGLVFMTAFASVMKMFFVGGLVWVMAVIFFTKFILLTTTVMIMDPQTVLVW